MQQSVEARGHLVQLQSPEGALPQIADADHAAVEVPDPERQPDAVHSHEVPVAVLQQLGAALENPQDGQEIQEIDFAVPNPELKGRPPGLRGDL